MTMLGAFMFGCVVGYICGFHDRLWGKPPPPLKGTYDSGEHEDRAEDYGDDWV